MRPLRIPEALRSAPHQGRRMSVRYCSNCGADDPWTCGIDGGIPEAMLPHCCKCGWQPGDATPRADSLDPPWILRGSIVPRRSGRGRIVSQSQDYGMMGDRTWGQVRIREWLRKGQRGHGYSLSRVSDLSRQWARDRLADIQEYHLDHSVKCEWCGLIRKEWGQLEKRGLYRTFCSAKCRDAEFKSWLRFNRKQERTRKWLREQRETLKSIRNLIRQRASA